MTADHIPQLTLPTPKTVTPQSRKDDIAWYQSPRWRALREQKLKKNPMCEDCERAIAQHVHHKQPRKEHPELAYVEENLESLCVSCHSSKEVK